jgi:predicted ABC-type ATPase
VLAGQIPPKQLKFWYKRGLTPVDLAINRVARRVQQGGHHIPEAVIRRYQAELDNFPIYTQQVNHWSFFNNDDHVPQLIAHSRSIV